MVDDLDRQLIDRLARDGRRAYTALAAELGVSEATVRTRVGKLQESGILRIVALCDAQSLGHQGLRLMVRVRDLTPRAVAKQLADMPMVNHVALCAGAHDIFIEATCRDIDQLVTLLDDIRRLPGVAAIDQLVLLELFKDYSWTGLGTSLGQRAAGG